MNNNIQTGGGIRMIRMPNGDGLWCGLLIPAIGHLAYIRKAVGTGLAG
jgi:hypothetical protein